MHRLTNFSPLTAAGTKPFTPFSIADRSWQKKDPKMMTPISTRHTVSLITALLTLTGFNFVSAASAASVNSNILSSAITLQRLDEPPVKTASGSIKMTVTPVSQTFDVIVKNILPADVVDGLAVFISQAPNDTNTFLLVNILSGPGTNGTWRLSLEGTTSAPAQFGTSSLTNLFEHHIRIVDVSSNVFLGTQIQSFVPSLRSLNYKAKVPLLRPEPAPSAAASGDIRIKTKGVDGSSVIEVRCKNLSSGNTYCLFYTFDLFAPNDDPDCPKTEALTNGRVVFKHDTGRGDQLAQAAVELGYVRIDQFSGLYVEVRDQFDVTHLYGLIP